MGFILTLISWVFSLGSLICFILVLVQMFKHGETTMGIICIVLIFCGIGPLIAFIYGWIKATEWNIKNVMLAWTVCFIGGILFGVGGGILAAGEINAMQQDMQFGDFPNN